MSAPSSTPGPWEVRTAVRLPTVHGSDGRCVASTGSAYHRPLVVNEANARLIAAAPELYAALEKCVEALGQDNPANNSYWAAEELGSAALAKARGEQ